MIRVLLAQVRANDDPMLLHERACIVRRLGERPFDLTAFNAVEESARPEMLDGVGLFLIGGSGDFSVHDPRSGPWVDGVRSLIERALIEEIPGLGLCFGHQLLGYHMGASVVTDPACSEFGTVSVRMTNLGRKNPLFASMPDEFEVQSGHSDRIQRLPEGLELLVTNDRCEIQFTRATGTMFYSAQFHPDLTGREAQDRARAYGAGMAEHLDQPVEDYAACFRPGTDASVSLIGRLADLAQQR